ncbi:MAG: hypothetical protein HYX73_10610 [Acidobacteria bacterium]|nr:hypothetical protein [Acidobacteriota bacterium]
MIFGFNTDVPVKEGIYHIQTEDRGPKHPVIESIIYVGGKIMGRKRMRYVRDEVTQERIEEMVRRQHKDLVEAIRSGTWAPSGEAPKPKVSPLAPKGYTIRLMNSENVRHGEFLRFHLLVQDKAENAPAASVSLEVRWLLGGEVVEKQSLHSQADGGAELWLPRPSDHMYGTLLISAQGPAGKELAKFHVRGFTAD